MGHPNIMSSKDIPFSEDDSEFEKPQVETPTGCKASCVKILKDNLFMILILVGVAVGFGLGFGLRTATKSSIAEQWINLIGTLYINVLDLTILPLIASNLIIVISNINPKEQGLTSVITLAFIIGMNILASAIGTITSVIIKPGTGITKLENATNEDDPNLRATASDVFADLLLNIFPDNIVAMCIQQTKTYYEYKAGTNKTEKVRIVGTASSKDLIGILMVSIAFGLAAKAAGNKGKAFLDFFQSLCEVTLKLVRVFLLLTPGGVCFMIAAAIMGVEDVAGTFSKVGLFVVTVTAGTAVLFILILLLYFVTTMRNPFKFLPRTIKAWFISFATTSPIVSLPEMFQGCDEFDIRPEISRFFCPIATTMKSDGPAIFISCACMFVAQLELDTVPPTTVVVIWLLTSVSVMAIPHVPSASILIAMTILNSAGVPTRSTVYLYAIDWLLDRFRAGVATTVTMYGAAILHAYDQRKSAKEDHDFIDESDQPSAQGSQIKRLWDK
ncbi:Excitatory amino acid transporter [Echinococcus granulosus]|uniref:Amino acid transporter n=1 Tax=Echinococcus granulosus TaxID=6210 RepID=W6UR05_ECHGR|nr:Excitatory amino acid transporter [Echinococcus granulosus]EUB63648.1 Excitatory amino acid transporter [Echinococcus granulosus]